MNNDQATNTGIQTCKQDRTSRESYFIHYNFQNTAALAGSRVKWSKTLPKPSTHIPSCVREGPLPHPRLGGCCRRGQDWGHLGFGFAGRLHLLCVLFRVCLLTLWQTSSSPCLSLTHTVFVLTLQDCNAREESPCVIYGLFMKCYKPREETFNLGRSKGGFLFSSN